MTSIADGLSQYQIRVVRFEFPYMAKRRVTGKKSPPNRLPILQEAFTEQIQSISGPLFIAGENLWEVGWRPPFYNLQKP